MTKFITLLFIILSINCFAGVSVVGTRFVINDNSPRMRIKIINDNQAEYIVKVAINDNKDQFVISPPLLILPKNTSNFVTIINQGVHDTKDHLYSLVVTAIPKAPRIDDKSTVSMAMRSNFHLTYRHNDLKNADFNQLKLEKNQNNQFYFKNNSNYALTILFSKQKNNTDAMRRTIKPNDTLLINKQYCQATCDLWVSLIDDNDAPITQTHLTSR